MNRIAQAKSAPTAAVPTSGQYISVKQAARVLNISEIGVRRFLTQKRLRRFKVGSRTLVLHAEVMGLIREVE
jgi:excisionase family DNA binding protein